MEAGIALVADFHQVKSLAPTMPLSYSDPAAGEQRTVGLSQLSDDQRWRAITLSSRAEERP
jgi:hypothetical protein